MNGTVYFYVIGSNLLRAQEECQFSEDGAEVQLTPLQAIALARDLIDAAVEQLEAVP